TKFFGLTVEAGGRELQLSEECRIAEDHALAFDHADRTLAGRRVEAKDARRLDAALLRGCDDRCGKRMLARLLDACGVAQHHRFVAGASLDDRLCARTAL